MAAGAEDCCLVDEVAHIDEGWINEGLYFMREYLLYCKGFALRAALTDLCDWFFLAEYGKVGEGSH